MRGAGQPPLAASPRQGEPAAVGRGHLDVGVARQLHDVGRPGEDPGPPGQPERLAVDHHVAGPAEREQHHLLVRGRIAAGEKRRFMPAADVAKTAETKGCL